MTYQSLIQYKAIVLFSSTLLLAACGGGGGDGGGSAPRTEQNVVYINNTDNTIIMAARDEGSISPFGLIDVNGANPFGLLVSPDSQHVAYKITDGNGTTNLYVTHANGAYNTQVTSLPTGRDVNDVVWSPDGSHLVYLADANTAGKQELFMTTVAFDSAANISASNKIISGTINSSLTLDIDSPKWSPDGTKVAYLVTDSARSTVNDVIGLNYHTVNIANLTDRNSTRLSTPSSFPSYQDITDYAWSANGSRLAYLSNPANDGREFIYEIDFASGSLTPASTAPAAGYSVTDVAYAADSQSLASVRYNSSTGQFRLMIDNVTSGSNINTLDTADQITSMQWANQIRVLAYRVRSDSTGNYSLKIADLDRNSFDTFLHNADTSGEHANGYSWSHDGDRLGLATSTIGMSISRLRVHNISTGAEQLVAGPTASGRFIYGTRWSQDDQRIAFGTAEAGCRNAQIHSTSSSSVDVLNLGDMRCTTGFVY